jgi:hypothetical protein
MLDKFRGLSVEKADLDELIALHSFGLSLKTNYATFGMEIPDWVNDNVSSLVSEIKLRRKDSLQKELRKAELALGALKTAEEKRAELRDKITRIKSNLE